MLTSSRGNLLILALSQALMLSAIVLAAILGSLLAPDKGLATLPVTAMVVGTAIASLPASALDPLSAGWRYDRFGWITLNLAVVPLLIAALITAVAIERQLRRGEVTA
jgi:hypothetical protein